MPDYYWLIIIILFVLVVCIIGGTSITLGIVKPHRRSLLETSILEEEKYPGIMEFYKNHLTKQYTIQSRYHYELAVYYLENNTKTNKFMVIAHGHTYTHHGCLKYARMMLKKGYNVILYDERYHGNSGGKFTSLGYYEKWDLYDVITDTLNRYGNDITIGTYGESMGAATVLLEGQIDPRIKFIVSDCGYSNFGMLTKEVIRAKFHIPVFPFYYFAVVIIRIFTGIKMKGISPIIDLNTIKVPVMFIHGKDDDYIPYHHTEDMYKKYSGPKELFLAGNHALHADSYRKDTLKYEFKINEFLKKYVD